MAYKGRFKPTNPTKYKGDHSNIIYRSLWERQFFRWCEANDEVVRWSSETVVIPYRCKTDNKMHRYFMDCKVKFKNGKTYLIEIKPECQVLPPVKGKKRKDKFLKEVLTYGKNQSKWEQAEKYAKNRGWEFRIFTEKTLKSLGIRLLNT